MDRYEYSKEVLGEVPLYPGHGVPLAILAMTIFADAKEALARTKYGCPALHEHPLIPGSGDGVYAASTIIRKLSQGQSPQECVSWANREWTHRCGLDPRPQDQSVQDQADRLTPLFLEKARTWGTSE